MNTTTVPQREELAQFAYLSGYKNPDSEFIQPLEERPKWEKDCHYRAADSIIAAGYRKPSVITSDEELDRELIVKSASYMDAFYLPSPGAPFRNVVTGAWVTLTELNMRGDFFPVTVLWDPEAAA